MNRCPENNKAYTDVLLIRSLCMALFIFIPFLIPFLITLHGLREPFKYFIKVRKYLPRSRWGG